MPLHEKIYNLRAKANLSQGDLADALGVSRQSISKWETGASVPELDKLIKLSELFHISLDELVLDKESTGESASPQVKIIYNEKPTTSGAAKTAGIILLCFAALVWLIVSLTGDVLSGFVLALPFFSCGSVCLIAKKNTGLWCTWVIYLFIELYLRFATGVSVRFILNPLAYAADRPAHLLIAWALVLIFAVLAIVTVARLKTPVSQSRIKNIVSTAAYWGIYIVMGISIYLFQMQQMNAVAPIRTFRLIFTIANTVQNLLLVAALTFTVRLINLLRRKQSI